MMSRYFASCVVAACALSVLLLALAPAPAHGSAISVASNAGVGVVVVAADGQCSLREAIDLANGNTDNADCVAVTDGQSAVTVDLPNAALFTLAQANSAGVSNGLAPIFGNHSVVIEGHGATITRSTASGTPAFRLLDFSGDALTLKDLTLSHGSMPAGSGGCIHMTGSMLTLDAVNVSHCSASRAGAIVNGSSGELIIKNGSVISNNRADNAVGGIENSGTLTMLSSTVADNTSEFFAAGILNEATATITDSTITGNVSHSDSQPGSATGGGINSVGTLTLTDSTISDNQAYQGAGLMIMSAAADTTITGSTLSGNTAENDGGGLFVDNGAGNVVMVNSTIAGNAGNGDGSSIHGGGIRTQSTATVRLSYVTLAGNPNAALYAYGQVTVDHSVIAAPSGDRVCVFAGSGAVASLGYNLDSDASCGFGQTSDHSGVAPQLGALADNGGATQTMLPAPSSPLVDVVPAADCATSAPSGPGIDVGKGQRGTVRPVGAGCDIGAVEAPQLIVSLTRLGGFNQHTLSGDPFAWPLVMQAFDTRGNVVADALFALQAPVDGASASCDLGAPTDATGIALIYCTANGVAGSYTVGLAPAPGFGIDAVATQHFNLTNDFNDRIFGDGFDGAPLATVTLTMGQSTADLAVLPPRGLLANRIVPILVVKDWQGHRVALVEARRGAGSVRLRSISYDTRGWPQSVSTWQVAAGPKPMLHIQRRRGSTEASLRQPSAH